MITFSYSNDADISQEQKELAKEAWLNKLGIFKDEFDEKDGSININFGVPLDDTRYYTFSFPKHDIFEFNHRFNEWVLAGQP
jgi:hypothetical protein